MVSIYDFTVHDIDGAERPLGDFRGKVLLIVNTASQCGFTYQYKGLEALHRTFAERGFAVLGFPCNQFGAQEPGDAGEIKSFCSLNYDVTFPLFAKVDVKGDRAAPLYDYLTRAKGGGVLGRSIKWNFTKFLIGRDGRVLARFPPTAKPEAIEARIAKAL